MSETTLKHIRDSRRFPGFFQSVLIREVPLYSALLYKIMKIIQNNETMKIKYDFNVRTLLVSPRQSALVLIVLIDQCRLSGETTSIRAQCPRDMILHWGTVCCWYGRNGIEDTKLFVLDFDCLPRPHLTNDSSYSNGIQRCINNNSSSFQKLFSIFDFFKLC